MLSNRFAGLVFRGAAVVALGAGSAVALGASPASATAFQCSAIKTSTTSGYAICNDGTGIGSDYYRLALTCRHQGSNYSVNGPWRLPTQRSYASCSVGSIYSLTVAKA